MEMRTLFYQKLPAQQKGQKTEQVEEIISI